MACGNLSSVWLKEGTCRFLLEHTHQLRPGAYQFLIKSCKSGPFPAVGYSYGTQNVILAFTHQVNDVNFNSPSDDEANTFSNFFSDLAPRPGAAAAFADVLMDEGALDQGLTAKEFYELWSTFQKISAANSPACTTEMLRFNPIKWGQTIASFTS